MAGRSRSIRNAVIDAFRRDIQRRYALKNVRRFDGFDCLPNDLVLELRAFLTESVYPAPEKRQEMDHALGELGRLLRSPHQLRPLMGTAVGAVLRLGPHLPTAVSLSLRGIDALREVHILEEQMVDAACELDLTVADLRKAAAVKAILAEVPEDTMRALIVKTTDVLGVLSNGKLLSTMTRILERCLEAMERRPDTYGPAQRSGVAMAIEILEGGVALMEQILPQDFAGVVQAVESLELDWYKRITERP